MINTAYRFYRIYVAFFCMGAFACISECKILQAQEHTLIIQPELIRSITSEDTTHIYELIRRARAYMSKNIDSAKVLLEAAKAYSTKINYPDGVAEALIFLGEYYSTIHQYNNSGKIIKSAYPYVQNAIYKKTILRISWNMAMAVPFSKRNQTDSAIFYLQKAIEETKPSNDSAYLITLYANIGGVWITNFQFDNAARYLKLAESLSEKYGRDNYLPDIYTNLAILYNYLQDSSNHFKYATKALAIGRQRGNIAVQRYAYEGLGNYYLARKNPRKAIEHFNKALSLYDEKNKPAMIFAQWGLGLANRDLGNYKAAEAYMLEALAIFKNADGIGMNLANIHLHLADLYRLMGNAEQVYEHMKENILLRDSINNAERNKTADELEAKYRSVEKDKEITENKLLVSQQQKKIAQQSLWIVTIAGGTLIALISGIMLYRNMRHRQQNQQNQIRLLEQEKELGLLKAGMKGEERERTRIAYELHDGIGGMLAAIRMNIDAVQERHKTKYASDELRPIMHMVEDTTDQVRKTAHNLMPGILQQHSLEEALRIYCSNVNTKGKLQVSFRMKDSGEPLPKDFELLLYRIAQELIQNVIKHAHATLAVVELENKAGRIYLLVEDNGSGFDTEAGHEGGFGLQNLKFRIQALHGYISIESAKERGTTINVMFEMEKVKNAFTSE